MISLARCVDWTMLLCKPYPQALGDKVVRVARKHEPS
jgi:hypothetical protein